MIRLLNRDPEPRHIYSPCLWLENGKNTQPDLFVGQAAEWQLSDGLSPVGMADGRQSKALSGHPPPPVLKAPVEVCVTWESIS
jgi:hypothetical protein